MTGRRKQVSAVRGESGGQAVGGSQWRLVPCGIEDEAANLRKHSCIVTR